jgi:DNA polymerase-3 subunit gamma/tau
LSYQVIARKWRPQSFDQLVGQNHISTTLQNALKNGRLPHALLFTGPRGTGKTSSARILAKALRCPNAVNFVPCNQCRDCQDIAIGRSVDVIEIDGASNNGVDAIRELRDTVSYMPSSGKYKIYIIDEVHMLSTSAFNALLKTLEEPPGHVVFILATTEVHKIPQTILSRCQRFDFRRIPTRQIADRLKIICEKESVVFEDEALWAIARQGDGSMRDSQSLLDQVITFANGPLTRTGVVEILGLTDHALLYETLAALVDRDQNQILKILERVARAGYEPNLFAQDLMENLRHLLLVKIGGEDALQMVELPDSEIRVLQDLSARLSEEEIHLLFDMAVKGAGDLARSSEPRVVLEMVLLRMAIAPRISDLKSLLSGKTGEAAAAPSPQKRPIPATKPAPRPPQTNGGLNLSPQEKWFELVQKVKSVDALLAAKIEPLLFNGLQDKTVDLAIPMKMAFLKDQLMDPEVQTKIKSLIEQSWGPGYSLSIHVTKEAAAGTSAHSLAEEKQKQRQDDLAQQVSQHPKVKTATAAFKGQIKSIKETGGTSK